MLIIWGTKVTRTRLGRVADYCMYCREAQPLSIYTLRSVGHLYYIPLGRGEVIGHVGRCTACRHEQTVDPSDYQATIQDTKATLEELVDQTNPDLPERIGQYLAEIDRARAGLSAEEDRQRLLVEPFLVVAPEAEVRAGAMQLDLWSVLVFPVFLAIPCLASLLGVMLDGLLGTRGDQAFGWSIVAGLLIGITLLLYVLGTEPRRYARRKYLPMIARSLADLDATEEEIDWALSQLRERKLKVGQLLKPAQVVARVQKHRDESNG